MKYGIWGWICFSVWDDKDVDVVCCQFYYIGKGKGWYMVLISKIGKGEERKMYNFGIIFYVMKIMEFYVLVVLWEVIKI